MSNLVSDEQLGKMMDKLSPNLTYQYYLVAVPAGKEAFWMRCQPYQTKIVQLEQTAYSQGAWDL